MLLDAKAILKKCGQIQLGKRKLKWKAKLTLDEMLLSAWNWEKILIKIKNNMKKILITGGAGFIGSHLVRLFVNKYPEYHIFNLDKLTYAGNLFNLSDIENKPNYTFIKGDIVDEKFIKEIFEQHQFDGVIHLAAESHVDRSITGPMEFIYTNIVGTANC